jgi:hypothetical protein
MWNIGADRLAEQPHIDEIVRYCGALAPREEIWAEIRSAVAGSADTRLGLACRIERRDGSTLDCGAQPLPDGATLLTFIDVTASVNVERALTEKNDALERASRLRDDFVHHVSYELRSPLTTIIGFTQLLGDETVGALNPRQREYAGHIMRSSGALLAIINDILDLASIDTGSLELTRETVDIRETIEAAVRGIEDRLAESSLRLEVDAPSDIGSFVADGKRGAPDPVQPALERGRLLGARPDRAGHRTQERRRGYPAGQRPGKRHPPRGARKGVRAVRDPHLGHPSSRRGPRAVDRALLRRAAWGSRRARSTPGAGTTVTCVFPADGAQRLAAE